MEHWGDSEDWSDVKLSIMDDSSFIDKKDVDKLWLETSFTQFDDITERNLIIFDGKFWIMRILEELAVIIDVDCFSDDVDDEWVEILDNDDNDFKDTGKWLDLNKALFDKIKANDMVAQLVCELDEYCHVLLLECELDMENLDISDIKYHWYKDINELNILFSEQLSDVDDGILVLLWTCTELINEEEELMEFWIWSDSRTDTVLEWFKAQEDSDGCFGNEDTSDWLKCEKFLFAFLFEGLEFEAVIDK